MTKRSLNHWLVWASVAGAACVFDVTGCGGGSSTVGVTDGGNTSDAANDSMSEDSGGGGDSEATDSGGGGDSEATDSGGNGDSASTDSGGDSAANGGDASSDGSMSSDAADGATSACPDATACSNSGANGVCSGGVCVACDSGNTSAGQDTSCTTAYGGGTTPYVCSAGSCIPGNCNSSTDCTSTPTTPTCGFSTPNVCGGCTEDSQCASGNICDTKTGDALLGTCVAATSGCATNSTNDVQCTLNSGDECCAGSCVAGNCCVSGGTSPCGASTTCKAETSGAAGGICTACAAVTGTSPVYYVDPVNGSDTTGTGNNTAANSCAFQTITRALQVIGTATTGTTINVVNKAGSGTVTVQGVATGTAAAGQEKFPIVLPSNVMLTTSGGAVVIEVPAAPTHASTTGILLVGNPSAVAGGSNAALTIDGQSKAATSGILVESAGATLSSLTVQNFSADGISVNDVKGTPSALAINAGVQSNGNGAEGLSVQGTSTASISSTTTPIDFNGNGAHGIHVSGTAAITVTGSVGASPPSTSTVVTSGNAAAGIWIQQTAGATAKNTLTGVVCTTSTQGNGLRIVPGSNVTVRSSWFLGNTGSGVDIENIAGGTGSSIANIDLGTMASPGGNVLQAPAGGSVNGNAGLCLAIAANASEQLPAQGNVFGGTGASAVNCASAAATLRTAGNLKCASHADVGGNIVAFPGDAGTGNTINVTQCAY
jgi:Cys-rich repeat protein